MGTENKDSCSQRDSAEREGYVRAHRSFRRIWKERDSAQPELLEEILEKGNLVPFPVSWTVKMKKKQKETQDILSYHTQAAGCSDKARAKASGGRQPIEECGRTGL